VHKAKTVVAAVG